MTHGGYRGGRRPPVWEKIQGEKPLLKMLQVPRHLHKDVKFVAIAIDKGLLTMDQIKTLLQGF